MLKIETRVHIRWLIRRDMPEVLAIERGCFPEPWREEDFIAHLRQRNIIGMVAELGERVMGYMLYELHHGHLSIINFAVDQWHYRRGIGSQMVAKLVSKLSSHRRQRIFLEVCECNLGAQLFFASQGFRALRVVRGRFGDEDAYRMAYRLAD